MLVGKQAAHGLALLQGAEICYITNSLIPKFADWRGEALHSHTYTCLCLNPPGRRTHHNLHVQHGGPEPSHRGECGGELTCLRGAGVCLHPRAGGTHKVGTCMNPG